MNWGTGSQNKNALISFVALSLTEEFLLLSSWIFVMLLKHNKNP